MWIIAAHLTLLIISTSFPLGATAASKELPTLRHSDVFFPPDLPLTSMKTSTSATAPPAPGYYETSEYLIRSVAVAVVFLESNGSIDASTENWTPLEETQVMGEIQTALNWWSVQNPSASVTFKLAVNYSVPTSYEPINRRGGSAAVNGEESLWIRQAMNYLGYAGSDYFSQVRDFINARRSSAGTNWAFAMFIVDSSSDFDGRFSDGVYSAYAYFGGPFLVMTYDNDGWGINAMDQVAAHEMGHIFYATDEYNGAVEFSGYLNVADNEGSNALMDANNLWLSAGTRGQIGWRDSDSDGIQDISDTFADSVLSPYLPDPTNTSNLAYAGSTKEIPYPNNNPKNLFGQISVTVNTIAKLECRVDGGAWRNATSTDGAFDEPEEDFVFTLSSLSSGTHSVEVRAVNSVGNVETPYGSDSVTVDLTFPSTSIIYSSPSRVKDSVIYVSAKTSFSLTAADTVSGTSASYYRTGDGSWTRYVGAFNLSGMPDGLGTVYYYSEDNVGNKETVRSLSVFADNSGPIVSVAWPVDGSAVNSSNMDIAWSSSDYVDARYFEIKIDSAGYLNSTSLTSHTFSSVSEGVHRVYIRAFDWLGNSKEVMIEFVVDVSAPTISLRPTSSVKNASELRTVSADLAWTGQDEIAGIDHYEVRLDDDAWIDVGTSSTYAFTRLVDGSHRIYVKAVDKAGNYNLLLVDFVVNTSLLLGPGWLDDALVLGAVGAVVLVAIGLFLRNRKRHSHVRSPSAPD